ncbi:MAG: hypothetical protein K2X43_07620 [Hyphomonadaceae bacterium]|nr:hypothetical protein [Hyphomonadaceae bacterium]
MSKRGWGKIGRCGTVAAGLALAVLLAAAGSGSALAQNKELSEKSVQLLMQYAWALTPPKFTAPDGKTIEVDKTKPKDVIVAVDVAREVIRVARLTAYAQVCELIEEQRANYQTLMRREEAKATWTDQQLLYISQLHLFTVMTLTGKVQIVEKEGDKQVVVRDAKGGSKAESCTETERQRIKTQIVAYINSAPPPAAKTAEPVKTGTQKK